MEAFALYLFRSVIWLTGFALVYLLFLRNERFFMLKRVYLILGILISFIFPIISIHIQVEVPAPNIITADIAPAGNTAITAIQQAVQERPRDYRIILLSLYLSGVLFLALRVIRHLISLYRAIKKANIDNKGPAKLIRASEFSASFSFFNYVFVNPSVSEIEVEEIMNHELVHVKQKHWFDLLLVELLRVFQWANPFVWIYTGFIRQNHEYLADEAALQHTSDPAIYRATLLNQIVGTPVISLANSFNYSFNKKRFNMMKNIVSSPYRKMKLLLILPVFAIVLYSFAEPDYKYIFVDETSPGNSLLSTTLIKEVKGTVVQQDGRPLQGATIIVKGTTLGVSADSKGFFRLDNVPDDGLLVVTYVGFKSFVIKPVFTSDMTIKMERDTVNLEGIGVPPPPPPPPPSGSSGNKNTPPPPPPSAINFRSASGNPPYLIVNGNPMTETEFRKIDPLTIESISVLKDKSAIDKYGEKGKDGVIEVTTKKKDSPDKDENPHYIEVKKTQPTGKEVYVMVEEMPMFPGGEKAMLSWLYSNMKAMEAAVKEKINDPVYVIFIVGSTGKIRDVKVKKSVHPLLDAEAIRVVSSMPDWKPGMQNGKPVDVYMQLPIDFVLK